MLDKRYIAIYTTASLPWMTGTAVNPLFRAAYLAKNADWEVTLVIPWLSLNDQELVFPNIITFSSPSDQEKYVRQWLEGRIDFIPRFMICFYPGKFSKEMRSILPIGDITEIIPDEEADIAILEEPEHLTWYHHGRKWKSKFRRVIGVVHTNYLEYVKREKNSLIACFLRYANCWVTYIYCDKNIRLSGATQDLPRSTVCNVHGVNPKFLEIGKVMSGMQQTGRSVTKGVYYIGKMIWSKGYRELLKLLSKHQNKLSGLQVDLYGSGEDSEEVSQAAEKLNLVVRVHPGRDHADPIFHDYKVFLNPSTTDVVCTTTAEALAMGKIVVCTNHPSNEFFKQFPNCRQFNNGDEFARLTLEALAGEPAPLTEELRHELSWEAATQRFVLAAELDRSISRSSSISSFPLPPNFIRIRNVKRKLEDMSASLHQTVSGIETARRMLGALPKSLNPDEQQRREMGLALPGPKKKS